MKDDFYPEENSPENEETGGFKIHNPSHTRFQRQFVKISSKKSKFRKTVQMIICVHGWEDETKKQPMTLIVFSCHLSCSATQYRYQSARMWLEFGEDAYLPKQDSAPKASPEVVAYAPFARTEKWNETETQIRRKLAKGAKADVHHGATLGVNADHEREVSFTRKYFDKGTSDPIPDERTGKEIGRQWYLEQNKAQKYGVEPDFKIAVLLKRSHNANGEPIIFQSIFDMRVEAGLLHDIEEHTRRFYRLWKPEDDPVYYKPDADNHVRGPEGEKMMENVNVERLGELSKEGVLAGLLNNKAGLTSGLEPFDAKV
ncbi:hypothetical protein BDV95DRAFT_629208 [Massariosphaeria phaeospora]|uniref:Uncharacterized protein n=1 Tax=Massariosphaeria phaeospora TaxID=100035 RepID=A0A7C8M788_9PLEO|nr:hypothetical protein BDV95DRAFT_629208 [Massariosphaeria phaeospora]